MPAAMPPSLNIERLDPFQRAGLVELARERGEAFDQDEVCAYRLPYDIDENGVQADIVVLVDVRVNRLLYLDYHANLFPT